MLDVFVRDYSAPGDEHDALGALSAGPSTGTPNNLLQCSSLIIGA